MSAGERYIVTLQPEGHYPAPPVVRLRVALKRLLRDHGLRCIDLRQENTDGNTGNNGQSANGGAGSDERDRRLSASRARARGENTADMRGYFCTKSDKRGASGQNPLPSIDAGDELARRLANRTTPAQTDSPLEQIA